jgi:hypothetical protein
MRQSQHSVARTTAYMVVLSLSHACGTPPPTPVPGAAESPPPPVEVQHTKAEWDAIVAAADRSAPRPAETPAITSPLSVAEAYAAIPHRYTPFNDRDTALEPAAAAHLSAVFDRMNVGVRVRVHGLTECTRGNCATAGPAAATQLRSIAAEVRGLTAPTPELTTHAAEVAAAMSLEADAFETWQDDFDASGWARTPAVREASTTLKAAWRRLGRAENGVSADNEAAFFDHHCALDFI